MLTGSYRGELVHVSQRGWLQWEGLSLRQLLYLGTSCIIVHCCDTQFLVLQAAVCFWNLSPWVREVHCSSQGR